MQWSNNTFTENLRRIAEKTQIGCYSKGIENPLKLNKLLFLLREGFPFFDEFLNKQTLLSDRQIE